MPNLTHNTLKKPFFITFEGGDGCGKSTQISLASDFLNQNNIKHIVTREPGGTNLGEKLRNILLEDKIDLPIKTEILTFLAARNYHVEHIIKPHLEQGISVLCDRFIDSTIAYQGYGRQQDIQFLETMNTYAINGLLPHLTFLLLLDPQNSLNRIKDIKNRPNQELDKIETASLEFHQRVYNGYIELSKKPENLNRILPIQVHNLTINELHSLIANQIKQRFFK